MQTLPLVSYYVCPRDRQLSSQRKAIKFDSSGLHYLTTVLCKRCVAINKSLGNILSGLPYETVAIKKEEESD